MAHATWLEHPRFAAYEVSDDGRVRSKPRQIANRWGGSHWIAGRELATFVRRAGYRGGNISVDGERINFEVHVMVCETFHGVRPDGDTQVRHLNGNRLDNRAENLCWGSPSENMLDKIVHGTNHEFAKTHCPAGHPYDEANTYRSPGAPRKRKCRACMKTHEANRPPRVKAR